MESNWSINRLTPGRRTRKTLLGGALWCTGPAPAHGAQAPPTQAALRAERIAFGGLICYVAGSGPPLVLVHSVDAAASAAEVRPVFEHCRATHTVFAIDLPGFGFSERANRRDDPRRMTDALHFLSGGLFSQDIHRIHEALSQPVWMSHGVRGDFTDFRGKRLVDQRGHWRTTVYPSGALPYFEVPAGCLADLDAFPVELPVDRTAPANPPPG